MISSETSVAPAFNHDNCFLSPRHDEIQTRFAHFIVRVDHNVAPVDQADPDTQMGLRKGMSDNIGRTRRP